MQLHGHSSTDAQLGFPGTTKKKKKQTWGPWQLGRMLLYAAKEIYLKNYGKLLQHEKVVELVK